MSSIYAALGLGSGKKKNKKKNKKEITNEASWNEAESWYDESSTWELWLVDNKGDTAELEVSSRQKQSDVYSCVYFDNSSSSSMASSSSSVNYDSYN